MYLKVQKEFRVLQRKASMETQKKGRNENIWIIGDLECLYPF